MKAIAEQNILNALPSISRVKHPLLYNMLPAALSDVPFHKDTASITRHTAKGFPFHLAVHQVSPVWVPPVEYTEPHWHSEHDEINIIISEENLSYKIQLGKDVITVNNNAAIFIPKGVLHAANVLQGSGFFITIRV